MFLPCRPDIEDPGRQAQLMRSQGMVEIHRQLLIDLRHPERGQILGEDAMHPADETPGIETSRPGLDVVTFAKPPVERRAGYRNAFPIADSPRSAFPPPTSGCSA